MSKNNSFNAACYIMAFAMIFIMALAIVSSKVAMNFLSQAFNIFIS